MADAAARTVSVAEAKAHLSELVAAVEAGESILITKRGKPVARISPERPPRRKITFEWLEEMAAGMPVEDEGAGDFMRRMRDDERY
ncbi:prevent-host-death family protein [Modestobacter sp. DSM 44400]|uniref:type II toxin-antitoxin system Phd/YefM family antitoxin n=1 Tax=Modestobacter sp. DSM 44400 TaxID=1550230 RepID=UPI0008990322|nr:type II toxin-antitoxin system prevent-host-death family antitoxin [Modestobacter sp. DSM 44400]SDY60427.1 prevent-host-death family protein [Modestobacter sp. DSM 44400]